MLASGMCSYYYDPPKEDLFSERTLVAGQGMLLTNTGKEMILSINKDELKKAMRQMTQQEFKLKAKEKKASDELRRVKSFLDSIESMLEMGNPFTHVNGKITAVELEAAQERYPWITFTHKFSKKNNVTEVNFDFEYGE